ncbi:relaxase/mobilization nuclease domain-containing protein [Pedobacter sp. MC2016-05]|uniref:relaxase/mobilization nuclease domain-containing protein n=1 Tax=Pedobacter sp. MC2016-05 TaxID=2994474 RepID=UPI0022462EFC|nr:relaxase/mobilization nuclease domain-containing protein [Pedobacter sp. MC2016-05]MCX2476335.1 relaxase/mobilization nuclease domain-containing protein [Pedobacter sp. MC2016-05]
MIVKILKKSVGFPAIKYNMTKVARGEAEILSMANAGILNGFLDISARDIEQYFSAVSRANSISKKDQLHVVFSEKGERFSKKNFEVLGMKWMKEMGFEKQPYMIFFHKDTQNRHIHIVSTTIRMDGSKISDEFDYSKALGALNKLLGLDSLEEFKLKVSRMMGYKYSCLSDFRLLLRQQGYKSFLSDGILKICRYGKVFLRLKEEVVKEFVLTNAFDKYRIAEIESLILHTSEFSDKTWYPIYRSNKVIRHNPVIAHRSELSEYLKKAHNVELIYNINKKTLVSVIVIDRLSKNVFTSPRILSLMLANEDRSTSEIYSAKARYGR